MENIRDLGSCWHHSGGIYCFGIVLSSGKVAIVSEYESGDDAYENKSIFWGIAPNADWRPYPSAKYGGDIRNKEELLMPTIEEIVEVDQNSSFLEEVNLCDFLPC